MAHSDSSAGARAHGYSAFALPADIYLKELAAVVAAHRWLFAHRFVNFFTHDCYGEVPAAWRGALGGASADDLRGMVGGRVVDSWPESLKDFVAACERLKMNKQLDAEGRLPPADTPAPGYVPCEGALARNLSVKKAHEVGRLAVEVERVARRASSSGTAIVDVGSGQGYLPTMLAHGYGRRVVAVEASAENNAKAALRHAAVEKLVEGAGRGGEVVCLPSFIRPDTSPEALAGLLEEHCGVVVGGDASVCLTGLHSCGDLTPVMLRLFAAAPYITGACVVGCCYYKMGWPSPDFPMSRRCREVGLHDHMGPMAAKLACEDAAGWGRMDTTSWADTQHLSMYRAVLEVVLTELYPSDVERLAVRGGIPTRHSVAKGDFGAYALHCINRLKIRRIDLSADAINEPADGGGRGSGAASEDAPPPPAHPPPSRDELNARMDTHAPRAHNLMVWLTLRECVAPLLEAVFIADRVQYLAEAAPHAAVDVRAVFDPSLSPRTFAICAVKPPRDGSDGR